MNVWRGLFRAWIVAAAVWVAGMLVLWVSEGYPTGDLLLVIGILLGPPIAACSSV